jgi:hypothetical protein
MPTRFTSLGVSGALTVAGLATLATVVITTVTATTGNFTTVNTQTLSGATIKATQASGIVRGLTLSGVTITALQANGIVKATTLSGAGLTISGKVTATPSATVRTIPCFLAGGAIGKLTVTATGAIATGACS